jgi:hypothetical protein
LPDLKAAAVSLATRTWEGGEKSDQIAFGATDDDLMHWVFWELLRRLPRWVICRNRAEDEYGLTWDIVVSGLDEKTRRDTFEWLGA